ncbi:hypothetical protein [Burkholderia thailandensis]
MDGLSAFRASLDRRSGAAAQRRSGAALLKRHFRKAAQLADTKSH